MNTQKGDGILSFHLHSAQLERQSSQLYTPTGWVDRRATESGQEVAWKFPRTLPEIETGTSLLCRSASNDCAIVRPRFGKVKVQKVTLFDDSVQNDGRAYCNKASSESLEKSQIISSNRQGSYLLARHSVVTLPIFCIRWVTAGRWCCLRKWPAKIIFR
jgi:hypothetical protein